MTLIRPSSCKKNYILMNMRPLETIRYKTRLICSGCTLFQTLFSERGIRKPRLFRVISFLRLREDFFCFKHKKLCLCGISQNEKTSWILIKESKCDFLTLMKIICFELISYRKLQTLFIKERKLAKGRVYTFTELRIMLVKRYMASS